MSKLRISYIRGIYGKDDKVFNLDTDILNKWIRLERNVFIKLIMKLGRNEFRIKGGSIRATGCFFFKDGILRIINGESYKTVSKELVGRYISLPDRTKRKFYLKISNNNLYIKLMEHKVQPKHEEVFEITSYVARVYNKEGLKRDINKVFSRIASENGKNKN